MSGLTWIKSSLSFSNGNCTEVASADGSVLVRDSQDPDGPRLAFPAGAWRAFTARLRAA